MAASITDRSSRVVPGSTPLFHFSYAANASSDVIGAPGCAAELPREPEEDGFPPVDDAPAIATLPVPPSTYRVPSGRESISS